MQGEWRPIWSAPKNGDLLLLGYYNVAGKWRTVRGQYFTQDQIDGEWDESESGEPGWYEVSENAEDSPNCWPIEPSHWMPMPSPPVQEEESCQTL
jgi:hypothetical protein